MQVGSVNGSAGDSSANGSQLADALTLAGSGYAMVPVYGLNPTGGCDCGSTECEENPTRRGKHPAAPKGYKATSDPARITTLWARYAERFGRPPRLGLVTGNGLVVVDVDTHKPPVLEDLALTVTDHTPRGSHAFYFSPLPIKSTQAIRPYVDVKAEGGYVVVYNPQLAHDLPARDTIASELPPVPAWVIAGNIKDRHQTDPTRTTGQLPSWLPTRIRGGARHDTLKRLAGWLRGCGHDGDTIVATLTRVRDERCEPGDHAVTDHEVRDLAAWAADLDQGTVHQGAGTLRERLEVLARSFDDTLGRRAASRRRVLLDGVVPCAILWAKSHNIPLDPRTAVQLSTRTVALQARVSRKTAGSALRELARIGVLPVVRRFKYGSTEATTYRLPSVSWLPHGSVATPSTEGRVMGHAGHTPGPGAERRLGGGSGASEASGVERGAGNGAAKTGDRPSRPVRPHLRIRATRPPAAARDLFRYGRLAPLAGEVYELLGDEGRSLAALAAVLGRRRRSGIRKALERLKRKRLARLTLAGWCRGSADPVEVERRTRRQVTVAGRVVEPMTYRMQQHLNWCDRVQYHSEDGQRARDRVRVERKALQVSVSASASTQGFPGLPWLRVESGEAAWRTFVKSATRARLKRARTLLAVHERQAARLAERVMAGEPVTITEGNFTLVGVSMGLVMARLKANGPGAQP